MGYQEGPQGQEPEQDKQGQDAKGPDIEEQDSYAFIQEVIKSESAVRKLTKLVLRYVGLGLIFGFAASLAFFALKSVVETANNPEEVRIPEEENEADSEEGEGTVTDVGEGALEAAPLTVDSYREMSQALLNVGNGVSRSLVEISAEAEGSSWIYETYDGKNSVTGVIAADNGQQLLILAKSSILRDAQSLKAKFADGESYNVELKRKDENLGFAVFAVNKSGLKGNTLSQAGVASLGSSKGMSKGDPVIALGSPFGYSSGMGVGIIASSRNVVERADGEYGILCTDIAGTGSGTGVLANISGEVVGMIDQTISEKDSMNLLTAYGITDLKSVVELMLNGDAVPYLGIHGVTVTEAIASEQGIPRGIYVREVAADSPAMAAGIQSGDIITEIGGDDVSELSSYHAELMKCQVGSEIKVSGQRRGTYEYVDIEFTVTVGSQE